MRPVHQPSSSSLSPLPIFSKLQVWGGCRNVELKKYSWKISFWKMMKSYFMVKQKSAPTSAGIERMTVFPDSRVMLHSTTAAPGKLWSLSTSKASRTPQKQNIRPDPLEMKPSSSAWWSNHPQTARVRWDSPLFPSSPNCRCHMFVIIINIMNIAIISTIITNSITKDEFDFWQCNTKQWLHLKSSTTINSTSGGPPCPCVSSPWSSRLSTTTWCRAIPKVIDQTRLW